VVANVKAGPVTVVPAAAIVVVTPCFPLKVSQSAEERKPFVLPEEVAIVKVRVFDEVAMERPLAPDVAKVKFGPFTPLMVVVALLALVPVAMAVILP